MKSWRHIIRYAPSLYAVSCIYVRYNTPVVTSPDDWQRPLFNSERTCPPETYLVYLTTSKPRIGITWYIHSTKLIEIHRTYAVIIGTVPAWITDILMGIMMSVFLVDTSALWTSLWGIACRYFQYHGTGPLCLVGKELFKLIKVPWTQLISLLLVRRSQR